MIVDNLIPEPYRLLAKLGAALALIGVLVGAVLWYGHHRYDAGAKSVQGKWDLAESQRKEAEAKARAAQMLKIAQTLESQTTINLQTETAHAETTTALRDLYGPGRVRQQPASADRTGVTVPAIASGAVQSDARTAHARLGAGAPAAAADCEGLRSDAAVTTEQLLRLQQWARDQGLAAP